ncbi:uncharacterized protein LOC112349589 [Selaginella moellendorffii]|uniref:uncharacterized protein LOC112349589 n=1 Tax=Selaginella moellendorffii TaxID=88036 RepID=UPI000D1CA245|nr:uncharacterized protein LOC112349589 [Selaginella moellendorffii]|eukprot:XP_024540015.1 uncharacterized protein LOC112349589 [Selaginella moellendorffii]
MNFSVEIWKRSFQRFGLGDPSKSPAAAKESEESDEEEDGFRKLQEKHAALEQRVRALETRLTYKEAQVLSFEEKLGASQGRIDDNQKEVAALARESEGKDRVILELKKEWEEKKSEWSRKEEVFVNEIQGLASELEDKCVEWNSACVEARIEKDRSRAMESSLREKIEELRCSREAREASQMAYDAQLQSLRQTMDRATSELQEKLVENVSLRKVLLAKDAELSSLKEEAGDLREKTSKLVEEIREAQEERHRLKGMLAATSLAYNKEVVSDLRTSIDPGNEVAERLDGANAKMKELESMLGELITFAREKDEKLDASEWTVQQLGLFEVSKIKASLAQAEKDHVQLKQEICELEKKLQFKEDELADMEKYSRLLRKQLRKVEGEAETMKENLQLAQAKYDGLKADHDAALSRIAGFDELKNNHVVISRHDDKLKQIHLELQRTKMNTKDLMEKMLSLQSSLVRGHDDKKLCSSSPGKNFNSLELPVLRKNSMIDDQGKSCNKRGRNVDIKAEKEFDLASRDTAVITEEPVRLIPKRQRQ